MLSVVKEEAENQRFQRRTLAVRTLSEPLAIAATGHEVSLFLQSRTDRPAFGSRWSSRNRRASEMPLGRREVVMWQKVSLCGTITYHYYAPSWSRDVAP